MLVLCNNYAMDRSLGLIETLTLMKPLELSCLLKCIAKEQLRDYISLYPSAVQAWLVVT